MAGPQAQNVAIVVACYFNDSNVSAYVGCDTCSGAGEVVVYSSWLREGFACVALCLSRQRTREDMVCSKFC